MRFIADGPSLPDDLLVARDTGNVVFFCGAGISQAEAKLPNFEMLARAVVDSLGSSLESPARKLLEIALNSKRIPGVSGIVATDRIFGLLEREFEVREVRGAIAEAIRPKPDCSLDAHQILLASSNIASRCHPARNHQLRPTIRAVCADPPDVRPTEAS